MFYNNNAVSDDLRNKCILREIIKSNNDNIVPLLMRITKHNKSIEKIDMVGDYRHYKDILTKDNYNKVIKKLSEVHFNRYGNSLNYKNYVKEQNDLQIN